MLFTEEEASEKYCCSGRNAFVQKDRNQELDTYLFTAYCDGSMCIAWRWVDNQNIDPRRGYCGLAGKENSGA